MPLQNLSSASPSPAFSVTPLSTAGRRLSQASSSGAQAQVNVETASSQTSAAQTAISNAVQNGDLANALSRNGETCYPTCIWPSLFLLLDSFECMQMLKCVSLAISVSSRECSSLWRRSILCSHNPGQMEGMKTGDNEYPC